MKKIFFFLILFFLFNLAYSLTVKVEVKDLCKLEVKSFFIDRENIPKINAEFYNSGSIPIRFRVFLDSGARYWLKEKNINPGEISRAVLPFFPKEINKIKLFYCTNFSEYYFNVSDFNLTLDKSIKITSARSYGDILFIEVESEKDSYLFILPSEYPDSWFFEKGEGRVAKGKRIFRIFYSPLGNEEIEVGFYLVSSDKTYNYQKVRIEKMVGIKYILYFYDYLRFVFQF